jgi:hypothetical protein
LNILKGKLLVFSDKSITVYDSAVLAQLGEKQIIIKQSENARLLEILPNFYQFLMTETGYKGTVT